MNTDSHAFTPIGETDWRNEHKPFYIKDADRLRHGFILGRTGQGKTSLMMNMAISDIEKGKGLCYLDPHGEAVDALLDYVPARRIKDVVYFDATDFECPIALNPLYKIAAGEHHIVADNLISTFKRIWQSSWGNRMHYVLKQCLLTLLHYPGATLLHIDPLLTNKAFREQVLMHVPEMHLRMYWYSQFDAYPPSFRTEVITPILGKVGVFNSNPVLRNIVGQQGCVDFREITDTGKILLVNAAKGAIGQEASSLLGSMVLNALFHAVLRRAHAPADGRMPFYSYVDELGSYMSAGEDDAAALASQLSEVRKYGLSLFLSTQYLEQLPISIQAAIFGNVGTIISFQIGNRDADVLAREFYPAFTARDFINLPKYSFYIRLMIDGQTSKGFSAISLPLPAKGTSHKNQILEFVRSTYSGDKEIPTDMPLPNRKPNQNTLF